MYSRVGTENWASSKERRGELRSRVDSILRENVVAWVSEPEKRLLLAELEGLERVTPEAVVGLLPGLRKRIPRQMDEVLKGVERILVDVGVPPEAAAKAIRSLRNDAEFARALKTGS